MVIYTPTCKPRSPKTRWALQRSYGAGLQTTLLRIKLRFACVIFTRNNSSTGKPVVSCPSD